MIYEIWLAQKPYTFMFKLQYVPVKYFIAIFLSAQFQKIGSNQLY